MSERTVYTGALCLISGTFAVVWTASDDFLLAFSIGCLAGTLWFVLNTALLDRKR